MIFKKLTVCDFGVFKGTQEFDLEPRSTSGKSRPIILFGGLNGSGKTSLLTAIRLALHGRQSLGYGTNQKKYEALISRLFHRSSVEPKSANETWIALDFKCSTFGQVNHYSIRRHWKLSEAGVVSEAFTLSEDGVVVESVDTNEAQAFLTQLVPVGVADLFFFDGEKIADLAAEDDSGLLTESIRQLFGLDVVAKLSADLDTYEKRQRKADEVKRPADKVFTSLQEQMGNLDEAVEKKYEFIRHEVDPKISSIRVELDKLEGRMLESGGSWAMSRNVYVQRQKELLAQRENLEEKGRELAAGILPLALLPSLSSDVLYQLEVERHDAQKMMIGKALTGKRKALRERLKAAGVKTDIELVLKVVSDLLAEEAIPAATSLHGLGESDREGIVGDFAQVIPIAISKAHDLKEQITVLDGELGALSARLAVAPAEEQLQVDFESIKHANQVLGELREKRRSLLREIKALLAQQIQIVRTLKKVNANDVGVKEEKQTAIRISSVKNTLNLFSERLASTKANLLAENFVHSFSKLSRKDSLISTAEVSPDTLSLKLKDAQGDGILKVQMSAGERQMFAVAILDALAKTSGRSIPIIIDTPLGRLDSQHRSNFVKHYLPYASHQVIVLSTDTEVDETFYADLEAHISHAYHLQYLERTRSSQAEEGYFWNQSSSKVRNVA